MDLQRSKKGESSHAHQGEKALLEAERLGNKSKNNTREGEEKKKTSQEGFRLTAGRRVNNR